MHHWSRFESSFFRYRWRLFFCYVSCLKRFQWISTGFAKSCRAPAKFSRYRLARSEMARDPVRSRSAKPTFFLFFARESYEKENGEMKKGASCARARSFLLAGNFQTAHAPDRHLGHFDSTCVRAVVFFKSFFPPAFYDFPLPSARRGALFAPTKKPNKTTLGTQQKHLPAIWTIDKSVFPFINPLVFIREFCFDSSVWAMTKRKKNSNFRFVFVIGEKTGANRFCRCAFFYIERNSFFREISSPAFRVFCLFLNSFLPARRALNGAFPAHSCALANATRCVYIFLRRSSESQSFVFLPYLLCSRHWLRIRLHLKRSPLFALFYRLTFRKSCATPEKPRFPVFVESKIFRTARKTLANGKTDTRKTQGK